MVDSREVVKCLDLVTSRRESVFFLGMYSRTHYSISGSRYLSVPSPDSKLDLQHMHPFKISDTPAIAPCFANNESTATHAHVSTPLPGSTQQTDPRHRRIRS